MVSTSGSRRSRPKLRPAGTLLALALLALAGCAGPKYCIEAPAAFKRFEESKDFRFITADGVMLKGREVDNYPKAKLPFWTDALRRHLEARGYTFRDESCFETTKGLDGCTLEFLLPWGAEDWAMGVTLFVAGKRIILLESAGPFDRYEAVQKALAAAYRTFEPGS